MTYLESSLAIIEYKLNELNSQRKWIDTRIDELVAIRDVIVKEMSKEYEPVNEDLFGDE